MSVGPVELVVLRFPGNHFTGGILPALQEVVDAGVVRVIDILFGVKDGQRDLRVFEMRELEDAAYSLFDPVVAEITGLLTQDDVATLSAGLGPDSSVAVLLFEHTWATRLRDAILAADGEVVLAERIPRQVIEDLVVEQRAQLAASAA